jgi:FAD/FMN-containing dehydrogenase
VIAQVTLRLVPRRKVERVVEIIEVRELLDRIGRRIDDGFTFGDCQYSTDFKSDAPHRGVFSCYRPVGDDAPEPAERRKLSDDDWAKLIYLGHTDKAKAFDAYSAHYLSTNGQTYWSDTHQMSADFDNYHARLDAQLGGGKVGSEMISEVYVRPDALLPFLKSAAGEVRERGINLIYGTIRFIEKDPDTFLAWAKERSVCVLCNIHVDHTPAGLEKAAGDFRRLIGLAIAHGGRYFLTYHRWASKEQVLAAYPQFVDFLKLKEKYDPEGRFQSNWYRHYRSLFANTLR